MRTRRSPGEILFDNLTPLYPLSRIKLETTHDNTPPGSWTS